MRATWYTMVVLLFVGCGEGGGGAEQVASEAPLCEPRAM